MKANNHSMWTNTVYLCVSLQATAKDWWQEIWLHQNRNRSVSYQGQKIKQKMDSLIPHIRYLASPPAPPPPFFFSFLSLSSSQYTLAAFCFKTSNTQYQIIQWGSILVEMVVGNQSENGKLKWMGNSWWGIEGKGNSWWETVEENGW